MVCGFVGYEETSPHHSQIDPDTVWMCLGLTTSIFWMCTPILLSPAVGGLKWLDGCRFMMINDQLFKTAILDTTNIYKPISICPSPISPIFLFYILQYLGYLGMMIQIGWLEEKPRRQNGISLPFPSFPNIILVSFTHSIIYCMYICIYIYIILYS